MKKSLALSFVTFLFAAGCTSESGNQPTKSVEPAKNGAPDADGPDANGPDANAPDANAPDANATAAVVRDVKCGCSIDGIGRCGNFVMIEGKYVPLIHPSLGKMEFCKQKAAGAKIETVGAMKDGKFVAESWKLVQ